MEVRNAPTECATRPRVRKLSNILINDMGDAVVCDFGVSRILGTKDSQRKAASVASSRWAAKEFLFEGSDRVILAKQIYGALG